MNTRRILNYFVVLVNVGFWSPATADLMPPGNSDIRILLTCFSDKSPLTISAPFLEYRTWSNSWTSITSPLEINPAAPVQLANATDPLTFRSANSGPVQIAQGRISKSYRGLVNIFTSKRFHVVNQINVDAYLRGVIPAEMPSSFPGEALKAQAICARSYALANRQKHIANDADLCDSTHCQAYEGVNRERNTTDAAIAATAGAMLYVGDTVLCAQYSADCGGVCAGIPSLGAAAIHQDSDNTGRSYCASSPNHSWALTLTQAQLLNAAGEVRTTPLRKLQITDRDSSGRVIRIRLTHDFGIVDITANNLIRLLGSNRVKSRLFSIAADPASGDLVFNGKGYGHGCGLCQWGAKGMADSPYNMTYTEILTHYYPGAALRSPADLDKYLATAK